MYTKYSIDEIKEKLKNCLNEERYLHSIGTMEMAVKLAEEYNCDLKKAQAAGLLHDCAKCLKKEELEKYKDTFEDCEKLSTKTWHAPVGAILAQKEYGVTDNQILSSIRWHTIGKKDMSDFEKIIFIADKIETRTRETEYREPITKMLEQTHNLDCAMFESFKLTIKSLVERKLPICYQTIDVYNYLLDKSSSVLHIQN